MLTFNEVLDTHSRIYPNKIAVQDSKRKLKFKDIVRNGNRIASFLFESGVKKGDRVAIIAYNCIEFAELMYASAKLGAIITPINFRLSKEEVVNIILDSKPKAFFFQNAFK